MSSPKSSMPPPSTPAPKDSPFINFANNLSPIQVISNKSNNQSFDSIDVPSPQPVFSTPQHRVTDLKLLKRLRTPGIPGPQRNCLGDADHAATSSAYPYTTRQSATMPATQSSICSEKKYSSCSDKKCNDQCHPQEHLCISPSNCLTFIDAFLAIPFEDCGNATFSPSSLSREADDLVENKKINPVSNSGDQFAFPNADSVQVPPIKTSVMATNSMDECTEHSEITSMTNFHQNKVVQPHALQKNSAIYKEVDSKSLVSNAGECSDPNVSAGQNASCQAETYSVRLKPLCPTVSIAFEETEVKGGLLGEKPRPVCKNIYINSDSIAPSVSHTQHEHIPLDKQGSDHFCVPNSSTDFRIVVHGDECSQTSSSCFPKKQVARLYAYRKGCCDQLDCTAGVKCGSIGNCQLHNNHLDISGQMTDATAMHRILSDQEDASHNYRGMCKRLQFEDCEQQERYNNNFMSFGHPHSISDTTEMPLNMDSQRDSNTNSIMMTGRIQPIHLLSSNRPGNYFVEADNSVQRKGRFTAIVPRSSGIGLHLNAIGNSGLASNHFNLKPMKDIGLGGQPFLHGRCHVTLNNMMTSTNVSGLLSVQIASTCNDSSIGECNDERQNPLDPTQDCHSPIEKKPLDTSLQPNSNDHHITPCSIKKLPSEGASKSEESTQTSFGKTRKRTSDVGGQKHCNCKRSKCLKLYCDCFAAGDSCNEACSCQGCSNIPEHEEMVSQAKQQIQARNPLAFAPKVVHANDSKDNKHITPPSARHKRGCNCKKSKCLKKYCECYQAGVGCSLACRCEGCQNAYGKKEAYGDLSDKVVHKRPLEDVLNRESPVEILQIREGIGKVSIGKEISLHLSSPMPLAQGTNENDVAMSARCQSPSNNDAGLPSDVSPTSTMDLASCKVQAEESNQSLSFSPYNQQFDFSVASELDLLSTGWNEFPDVCNITPLPDSLFRSTSSSSELAKISQKKLWQYRYTSSSDSLCQCSSVTLHHFLEGKYVTQPATSGQTYNVADETPEILKDTRSPIMSVKASSPHQKRVSPPQKLLHEAVSSSSSGLKSVRKIILHSIPQFPLYSNNLTEGTGGLSEKKIGT